MRARLQTATPKPQEKQYSTSPSGERFQLPGPKEYRAEFARLRKVADRNRKEGREIVVVVGLGFVGAVMAAVVADSMDRSTGRPGKFVIGMQRPSPRSYWKTPLLNRGISPIKAEDPEVDVPFAAASKRRRRWSQPTRSMPWLWRMWWSWTSNAIISRNRSEMSVPAPPTWPPSKPLWASLPSTFRRTRWCSSRQPSPRVPPSRLPIRS